MIHYILFQTRHMYAMHKHISITVCRGLKGIEGFIYYIYVLGSSQMDSLEIISMSVFIGYFLC